jgi:hypothetical protein
MVSADQKEAARNRIIRDQYSCQRGEEPYQHSDAGRSQGQPEQRDEYAAHNEQREVALGAGTHHRPRQAVGHHLGRFAEVPQHGEDSRHVVIARRLLICLIQVRLDLSQKLALLVRRNQAELDFTRSK